MNETPKFVTDESTPQVKMPFGAYRRTMGTTEHIMLLEVYVPRETVVPEHSHVHEQVGYVVSGRIEFTIGGEMKVMDPGDSYAVASNVLHSARAVYDTVLVEVFSPPREDFRPSGS
ncbi:MAG: cupin domain-containing protein [Chloroflexi bacterium]|nr:cupin domain-containing protein [Chloroflexota bacterium]